MVCSCALSILLPSRVSRGDEGTGNIQHFEASPHAGDFLMLRSAAQPVSGFSGGFLVSYARNPLKTADKRFGHVDTFWLVEQHLVADLFAGYAAWERFSAGLNMPVVLFSGGDSPLAGDPAVDGSGVGDLRLAARYLLLPRREEGLGLGFETGLGLPTATQGLYSGDSGVSLTPWVVADYRLADTTIALNAGYRIQGAQTLAAQQTGGGPRVGLGAVQSFNDETFRLVGELHFKTSHEDFFGKGTSNLEGQLGIDVCVGQWARAFVATGGGMLSGVGEPSVRFTSGFRIERCRPELVVARVPVVKIAPPVDTDGDGIFDKKDACPKVPGITHKDDRKNGGPADRDDDGFIDKDDACPDIPGEANENPKQHGCPPPKVTKEKIEIGQRIEFEVGEAVLLEGSEAILDGVAKLMNDHPEVVKVIIEGHTDNTNTAAFNLALSQKRAQAVLDYLVKKGVDKKRLKAQGLGLTRPIADNETEEGRKANRRVEFRVIMESDAPPEKPEKLEKP